MKKMILAALIFASHQALARQYIQCSILSDSTDVAVVNLTSESKGTLFLSSGMQNPEDERILVDLQIDKKSNNKHYFKIINANTEGFISIPSSVIGKATDGFLVELSFAHYQFDYACFSRLYNDD
jgi:hypothetical protein